MLIIVHTALISVSNYYYSVWAKLCDVIKYNPTGAAKAEIIQAQGRKSCWWYNSQNTLEVWGFGCLGQIYVKGIYSNLHRDSDRIREFCRNPQAGLLVEEDRYQNRPFTIFHICGPNIWKIIVICKTCELSTKENFVTLHSPSCRSIIGLVFACVKHKLSKCLSFCLYDKKMCIVMPTMNIQVGKRAPEVKRFKIWED